MTKLEEARKEVVAAKEWLERALVRLDYRIKEEEETVTLQLASYNKTIPQTELFVVEVGSLSVKDPNEGLRRGVATREKGPLARKAFALNDAFDWEIGRDEEDALCLVPIKKEVKNKKKDIIGHFEPR